LSPPFRNALVTVITGALIGLSTWQVKGQGFVDDDGQTPYFDLRMLSDPMMDYTLGYAHGDFIDSAFVGNLQQLTDWDLANGS
jgi:hypothetical protein